MKKNLLIIGAMLGLLTACGGKKTTAVSGQVTGEWDSATVIRPQYAKGFTVKYLEDGMRLVEVADPQKGERLWVGASAGMGEYPMCGVLPYKITDRKTDRRLSLGYRRFMLDGREYRGHEFHYTQFLGEKPKSVTQVYNAKGEPVDTPVFRYKNVLASYTHLYLTSK